MTITTHTWKDGIRLWTLDAPNGDVQAFFWSAQQAADYAHGRVIRWNVLHHEH